jgi:SET domain-containing protein
MENFNKLRDWLNLSHDNLVILEKGSRGVISKKSIKKGTVIMQIPESYLIEYSNVAKKVKIPEKKINNKNSLMATYFLLESINPKSKWHPYLATMPQSLDEYIYFRG